MSSYFAVVFGMPRSHIVLYALAAVAVIFVGLRYLDGRENTASDAVKSQGPLRISKGSGRVEVHVAGAVRRPGVYRVRSDARVDDALRSAGGALRTADLNAINLAAKLIDGQQVVVPSKSKAAAAGGTNEGSGPVSLSNATAEDLDAIEGVGPVTAQKIIDYRTQQGGFSSVEDLKKISGIGDKRFQSIKDEVAP